MRQNEIINIRTIYLSSATLSKSSQGRCTNIYVTASFEIVHKMNVQQLESTI